MIEDEMIEAGEVEDTSKRDDVIAKLSTIISEKRKHAVSWREQSGIEAVWTMCEEHYEGYDEASKADSTSLAAMAKPATMDGVLRSNKGTGRSRVFMNLTRPYVDAAAARVSDMLLPTEDRPWGLEETSVPKLSKLAEDMTGLTTPEGGPVMLADAEDSKDEQGNFIPRQATKGDKAKSDMAEAQKRADLAENQIADYLEENKWTNEVRRVISDCARLGTGVLMGPVPKLVRRRVTQTDEFGNAALVIEEEHIPESKRIDPWDFYPDPASGENHQNGSFIFLRDRITERKLSDLKADPSYFGDVIESIIEEGPSKKYETSNRDEKACSNDQYEIWYYYGALSTKDIEDLEVDLGELDGMNSVMAIVTMVNDRPIKVALSPLDTDDFPVDVMPWQRRKGMCFGIGVAEQGNTAQRLLNAGARQWMDNSGVSVMPQFVFRKGAIIPVDGNYTITPGKGWYIPADADVQDVQQAMMFIDIPNHQQEIMGLVNFAMKFMEDSTGLPMLLQGQQAGATDTVGGMILLNNNAGTVLRNIARLFDDNITEPHIRRYYEGWLMQYGPDECKGDMTVKTYGSSALVERDVANQDIQFIGQLIGNAALFDIDPAKWFAEWAKSRRLSPEAFQMDEDKKAQMQQQQPPPSPQQITAEASMKVAEIRSQTDMGKAQLVQQSDMAELQFKAQEAERQRQHEARMAEMDMQIRMMAFAESRNMNLDKLKAQLTMKASDNQNIAAERALKVQVGSGI